MARKRKHPTDSAAKPKSTEDSEPATKSPSTSSAPATDIVNTNPGLKLGKILEAENAAHDDDTSSEDDSETVKAKKPAPSPSDQLTMDFSSNELPKAVGETLDSLLQKITDLQQLFERWIKLTPAERLLHFTDLLEEERMSLWIMNALVSLGEVYCRMQGMDPEKEGFEARKELLNRYAYKFDELEPHSRLLSNIDGGPKSRLDMPAVKRFLKPALMENPDIGTMND